MSPESDILVSSTRGLCLLLKTCACNRGLFITTEVLNKRGRSFFLCKSPPIFFGMEEKDSNVELQVKTTSTNKDSQEAMQTKKEGRRASHTKPSV